MTDTRISPLLPALPQKRGDIHHWGHLYGASAALAISRAAGQQPGPLLVVTGNTSEAQQLEYALRFFSAAPSHPVLHFPDWETLPYDAFSPHQDIISERLACLARLPSLQQGILLLPIQTLMHRIAPRDYLEAHSLMLDTGQQLELDGMRQRLNTSGYSCVSSVMEHGEILPTGSIGRASCFFFGLFLTVFFFIFTGYGD